MDILQRNLVKLNNKSGSDKYDGSHVIERDSWTPSLRSHEAASERCKGWWTSRHDLWSYGRKEQRSLQEQRPHSSPIRKGGGAYFSPRPPIVPMHVVFSKPLDRDSVQGHLKPKLPHCEEIPSTLCGSIGVSDSPGIIPPVFIADSTSLLASASALTASSCRNSQGPARVPKLTSRYSQKSESGDMVRLLLLEFIISLPLPILTPDTNVSSKAMSYMSLEAPDIPQEPSSTQLQRRPRRGRPSSGQSHCNIAVQAPLANEKSISLISHDCPPLSEWVGGVRALRDSHVRLVLHQLRHIDRLNRALDRTSRPPRPPRPRSGPRPRPRSARTLYA